jgi:flagellar secretion chaperone FliS
MTAARNPFSAYQKTQVTTASNKHILVMLYEGAIKFVKLARTKMIAKDVAEKGKYISKTLAILSELMNTLDHEKGGQLAVDLENLYSFMIDKLIEGNIKNDPACLESVEKILLTLHVAWVDVTKNPRPDGVPSADLQPELHSMYKQTGKIPEIPAPDYASQNKKSDAKLPELKIVPQTKK